MISLYLSGQTWLHRIPAAVKLVGLALASIGLLFIKGWMGLMPVLLLLALAQRCIGQRQKQQLLGLRNLVVLIVALGIFQGLVMDWNQAANTVVRILVMVMLADLVTMTTPLQRLLDLTSLLFAPLDRLGNIRRQLGFAVALMIRFVPLLAQQWDAQRCAYRARTSRRPKPFLLAAFLSQALRKTDQIAESIAAREAKKRPLR